MSTDYLPRKKVPYNEVRSLSLSGISVGEAKDPPRTPDEACVLCDGKNYLWVYAAMDGGSTFTRYGGNDVTNILERLGGHFGVGFVSEYDDEFQELVDGEYRSDFITFEIPEGYLGQCARCLKNEAKHTIIEELSAPVTTWVELGLPPVSNIRIHVCEQCLRDSDVFSDN